MLLLLCAAVVVLGEDVQKDDLSRLPSLGALTDEQTARYTIAENLDRLGLDFVPEHDPELFRSLGEPTSDGFTLFHPLPFAIVERLTNMKRKGKILPDDFFPSLLRYHLLPKTVFSKDLVELQFPQTMMNNPAYVNKGKGVNQTLSIAKFQNSWGLQRIQVNYGVPQWDKFISNVIFKDIKCSNGVIHFVDKVFEFPLFSSWMLEDIYDQSMVSALEDAQLTTIVESKSCLTFFVPDNAVLDAVLGTGDIAPEKLKAVLLDHMAAGCLDSLELSKKDSIKMLSGKTLKITAKDDQLVIGGATVEKANLLTKNGVLHTINKIVQADVEASF